MSKKGNVSATGLTPGLVREMGIRLLSALPLDMTPDIADGWISNPGALNKAIRDALLPPGQNAQTVLKPLVADWPAFCEHLGLKVSMEGIKIPDPKKGYIDLFVPKGLTYGLALESCRKNFSVYTSLDLEKSIDLKREERTPKNGSYFVRFKLTQEADKKMQNISADEIKAKGLQTITCLERIWLEKVYWCFFGKHLDIENWTLCSGSRYSGGGVPCACWGQSYAEFRVFWCGSGYSCSSLRAREAVSL